MHACKGVNRRGAGEGWRDARAVRCVGGPALPAGQTQQPESSIRRPLTSCFAFYFFFSAYRRKERRALEKNLLLQVVCLPRWATSPLLYNTLIGHLQPIQFSGLFFLVSAENNVCPWTCDDVCRSVWTVALRRHHEGNCSVDVVRHLTKSRKYTRHYENAARQFRALRVAAMAHLVCVPVSPLSFLCFSASNSIGAATQAGGEFSLCTPADRRQLTGVEVRLPPPPTRAAGEKPFACRLGCVALIFLFTHLDVHPVDPHTAAWFCLPTFLHDSRAGGGSRFVHAERHKNDVYLKPDICELDVQYIPEVTYTCAMYTILYTGFDCPLCPITSLGSPPLKQLDAINVRGRSEWLYLGEPGSIPGGVAPGFSHGEIVSADAAGWRVFSGISRFPRTCIPAPLHALLTSPSSALQALMLRASKISPLRQCATSTGDKGDTTTRIKCAIAAKRKALIWHAVFSSYCLSLWDFQRYNSSPHATGCHLSLSDLSSKVPEVPHIPYKKSTHNVKQVTCMYLSALVVCWPANADVAKLAFQDLHERYHDYGAAPEWMERRKQEIPEKTHRLASSFGTIPTCGNNPAGDRTRLALVGGEHANRLSTSAPLKPPSDSHWGTGFDPRSGPSDCGFPWFAEITSALKSVAIIKNISHLRAGAVLCTSSTVRPGARELHWRVKTVNDKILSRAFKSADLTVNSVYLSVARRRKATRVGTRSRLGVARECGRRDAVRLLASRRGQPRSIYDCFTPDFRKAGIVLDDAGCRRVFSGSPVLSPPFHSVAAPYSHRCTPIGSQDLDRVLALPLEDWQHWVRMHECDPPISSAPFRQLLRSSRRLAEARHKPVAYSLSGPSHNLPFPQPPCLCRDPPRLICR
ncbi:hypothetical protein PR048_002336 [Dryococelus australis]|uniref:Uncharacterized protein n=1 Tax=Dryococelus australis TaxID=614101 RepID=A0ABQ9IJV4_9NEOP|nr:hypothetical protein PR048_002336 [Dryococelus australis]